MSHLSGNFLMSVYSSNHHLLLLRLARTSGVVEHHLREFDGLRAGGPDAFGPGVDESP